MRKESVPTHNIDAEASIISTILIDNKSFYQCRDLNPDDFYNLRHKAIFGAILSIFDRGDAVDLVTVGSELNSTGKLKSAGGASYLAQIADSAPIAMNMTEYTGIVKDCALNRSLRAVGSLIVERANHGESGEKLLEVAQSEIIKLKSTNREKSVDMTSFSLTGLSEVMQRQMLSDRYALGRLAILGQSTAWYSKPNTGKTLLALKLLAEAIAPGEINGHDVFYINADDTYKGLVYKLKLAEKYGFHMIAPSHKGPNCETFESRDMAKHLKSMVENDQAKGKIFILDTAKKFTNLMSKDASSEFGEVVRQFVSHGGTMIMLAHANKHRDDDRKIVYSGTTDLVDDADCAYTIDTIQESDGMRTVKFENFKNRGDVAMEAFYQYDCRPETMYYDRFNSVREIGDEEREATIQKQSLDRKLSQNQGAVSVLIECMREGIATKTALIAEAHERSDLSKAKIKKALNDHTGSDRSKNQFWHTISGDKNAKIYELNYGM